MIAKEVGNRSQEGVACGNLGKCYYNLGDFQKSLEYHERAWSIAKELGDRIREEVAYGNQGDVYRRLENLEMTIECLEKSLAIMKQEVRRTEERMAYCNLGVIYHLLGNITKAIECHKKSLSIAREVSDKAGMGRSYANLGNCYRSRRNLRKAFEYHELSLKIAKEVGDRTTERMAYTNLGNAYHSFANFQKAIEYYEKNLSMAIETGDRAEERGAYCNLGVAYGSLGNFIKAIEYQKKHLSIEKQVGDRFGEGKAYGNLGYAYHSLGDMKMAIKYHEKQLSIAIERGDRITEGAAYGGLGNDYASLGNFQKALDYHEKDLSIAKEVGDRLEEGKAYGNLGNTHYSVGHIQKAIEHHNKDLSITKEVNDKIGEGKAHWNLGIAYEALQDFKLASENFQSSVELFDFVRFTLNPDNAMEFRELYRVAYRGLWQSLLKLERIEDALHAAEKGRAQALVDVLTRQNNVIEPPSASPRPKETISYITNKLSTKVAFIGQQGNNLNFWVIGKGSKVEFRQRKVEGKSVDEDSITVLLKATLKKISSGENDKNPCEVRIESDDDNDGGGYCGVGGGGDGYACRVELLRKSSHINPLQPLHDAIIGPIIDLCRNDDLIVVPEGPLCLAPLSALSESIRIWTVPSLTSLKLIMDSLEDCNSVKGALLVGDPYLGDVRFKCQELKQLPFAKEEVEMIGEILQVKPLTGKEATKDKVLKRIKSAALVHIAGHGQNKTGEIFLSPNPGWMIVNSESPNEEDFILKMSDVQGVRLRAKLVVLSCCHSGRGEIKSEGVIGIARAFLAAGARSVLISLWAIDDEATLEFMRCFYQHLVNGKSASVALHQAMKCLRESEKFFKAKYWAPFVLIGADVTLDFGQKGLRDCK